MDQRATVDVICKAAIENLAGEIGALLGQEISCSDIQLRLCSKDAFFNTAERDKTAFTRMSVTGDQEGDAFLLTRINSAVILGGTLIMLPEEMIEEHAQSGNLDGELADAFGEVANIVAGVFTQTFVDKYSKSLRFIKKSVEELVPTKIDPASEEPFPPGDYHVSSCILNMGEKDLGLVEFVVPAAIFELEDSPAESAPETAVEKAEAPTEHQPEAPQDPPQANVEQPAETPTDSWPAQAAPVNGPDSATPQEAPEAEAEPPAAAPKQSFASAKKLTDTVFKATIAQVSEEIGALIGQPLSCDDLQLEMVSKADFFATHCLEKSVLTQIQVSGDHAGTGFLAIQVPDAIILGGTLIMLPEDQIAEQAQKKQFEGEAEDAYGEVANILAGGLTQVFLDRYPKQLRFVRTDSEIVEPTKVDSATDQPFPEGDYYLASFSIAMEGYELQRMLLVFPAAIFDLDTSHAPAAKTAEETVATAPSSSEAPAAATTAANPAEVETAATSAPAPTGPPVVLIICEQPAEANPFAEILVTAGHETKVLSFQDDIKATCQEHQILGVFLLMSQVSEKGFATAIKLQSSGRPLPPMIFAGPEWTRSAVLRAVKYGARDILVLPASNDEIQEKVTQHLLTVS